MLITIAGDSFTGKTVSAATFPKPMLFVDIDNGFKSVYTARKKDGSLVVKDIEKIEVVQILKNEVIPISLSSVKDKGGTPPPQSKTSFEAVMKYNKLMEETFKQPKKYKSLVIDSLTSFFRLWKDGMLYVNNIPALRMSDYQTLEGILFGQFIPMLKSLDIEFIILIDHIDMDKDELIGKIMEFPIGTSRNVGRNLGRVMDELYRQRIEDGKYVWKSQKTGFFQAGSRLSIPETIEANYDELEKWLSTQRTVK